MTDLSREPTNETPEEVYELCKRLRAGLEGRNGEAVVWLVCTDAAAMLDSLSTRLAQAERERDGLKVANEAAHLTKRWNVYWNGEYLMVCRGDHEKSDNCHWERFVPIAREGGAS